MQIAVNHIEYHKPNKNFLQSQNRDKLKLVADKIKLSAYCLIENKNRFLLTEDEGKPGWKLPGGEVQKGETILAAAIREVKEETGLIVLPTGFITLQEYLKEKQEHRLRFYLTAKLITGRQKVNAGEIKKIKWFPKYNLKKLKARDFFIKQYFWAVKKFLADGVFPLAVLTTF